MHNTMHLYKLVALAALVVALAGCGGRPVDGLISDADVTDTDLCSGPTSLWPSSCFRRCGSESDCVRVGAGCCCNVLVNHAYREMFEQKVRQCEQQLLEDGQRCSCWISWDCVREIVCLQGACRNGIRCAQP